MMKLALGLLCFARVAGAWTVCGSEHDTDLQMTRIEQLAKANANAVAGDPIAWECTGEAAKRLAPRIAHACTAILDRDGAASPCVELAASAGFATLGNHDIFAIVTTDHRFDEDPIESSGSSAPLRLEYLERLGDRRGAALIVAAWNATIPRAARREQDHGVMADWSSWRQRAAHALGAIGGTDEAAFLAEQASATVDKHVYEACRDAIAAIRARSAP